MVLREVCSAYKILKQSVDFSKGGLLPRATKRSCKPLAAIVLVYTMLDGHSTDPLGEEDSTR